MGDIADMMLEGEMCSQCGEILEGGGAGFARLCRGCRAEESGAPARRKSAPRLPFPTAACKGCGLRIVWVTLPNGKKMPLDLRAPTYTVEQRNGIVVGVRQETTYVSHFATCEKARDFSASKKRG